MNERSSYWKRELGIIPQAAVVIAIIAFACVQVVFSWVVPHFNGLHGLPPQPWWSVIGIFAGLAGALFVLILGYIYSDAKRRGMSGVLWLFIVLIFKALGLVAYLLLRKPLVQACPSCGNPIVSDYRFCPKCKHELGLACSSCGRPISNEYVCCPYCGKPVAPEVKGA